MSDEQDFDFLNDLDNILGKIDEGDNEFELINELESDVQPTIALPNMNLFAEEVQQLRAENHSLHSQLQEVLNRNASYEVLINDLNQQKVGLQKKLDLTMETIQGYRQEIDNLTRQLQEAHGVTVDVNQKLSNIDYLSKRNQELEKRVAELQSFENSVRMIVEVVTGTPADQFSLNLLEKALSGMNSTKAPEGSGENKDLAVRQRKEEITKIKSKCYAYLLYMRKRYEQITGWRFDMKSPSEYQFTLSAVKERPEFKYTVQLGNRLILSPNPFLSQNMKMLDELKLKNPPDAPEANRSFYPTLMAASVLRAMKLL
ncbi:Hypothetical protein GLP15_2122 [Giardia lamblia P15]|uniref:Uncharacterized protein n=1 Tax=Giardia intestinalis (strain P15) TaxID=658858 RepID=E1EY93_GIAIA|nr:Hypothetical protein GLP15_2122 [Giardia lamblia P15]